MAQEELPRVKLAHLPTPIERLDRLTEALGVKSIFLKRDDLTGLAGGGNKTRKLEFLVAQALAEGADTLVTLGSAQSNHCRQTAAAASKCGLRCILVLRGDPPPEWTGNLLLDHLLNAEIRWSERKTREEMMEEVLQSERAEGRRPYPIILGGSTGLGAVGYAKALEEVLNQISEEPHLREVGIDRVIFPSSSGGTHAGLAAGAHITGFRGEILGISIDEELNHLREMVAGIASDTCRLMGAAKKFAPREIRVNADYLGGGYGVLGEAEREAITLFARLEGILLDPVYTARAAAGMIDLIRNGRIASDETILFWHTGGLPALYAYAGDLGR